MDSNESTEDKERDDSVVPEASAEDASLDTKKSNTDSNENDAGSPQNPKDDSTDSKEAKTVSPEITSAQSKKDGTTGGSVESKEGARGPVRGRQRTEKSKKSSWNFFVAMTMCGSLLMFLVMNGDGNQEVKLEVKHLDESFYRTVLYPDNDYSLGGPNGMDVKWAVFFHKPYCGACRRIRPVFEALAQTTNSSSHLRFASLDCVRYRVFCQRVGVDKEPLIRIYGVDDSAHAKRRKSEVKRGSGRKMKWQRQKLADWQGALIAYEVVEWFKSLQAYEILSSDFEWPEEDLLAEKMNLFKETKTHKMGDKLVTVKSAPNNPTGYLTDIKASLYMGLIDDVFGAGSDSLEGSRFELLLQWIEVLSHTYPEADMRARLAQLLTLLSRKPVWRNREYTAQLKSWGLVEPTEPDSYQWCRSSVMGEGGYPCGLWLLFHTILTNSDRSHAPLVLTSIKNWVENFYGCVECAANFLEEWDEYGGEENTGHVDSVIWLWKVHNLVRERLTIEDDSVGTKTQWPTTEICELCFTEETRNSSLGASTDMWNEDDWQTDFVFAFMQETFCAGSDTYVCAAFSDPN
uniref:Sulfhydryl oxidase n=1 Tax=Octactis speculum TaxID=3111310 RepID=A0A7S2FYC4_9STRA|mmetsp:Transcript_33642/g.45494  ORF Transcript_33642/g.45494 Transcript_33642/m.45494 type:complete len:574 (+) Transcript_33642:55-1776(+)